MDIAAIEFTDELFADFEFSDAPYGYDITDENGVSYRAFPNELITPSSRCLIVNELGKGFAGFFLGGAFSPHEAHTEVLVMGLDDPLFAFSCKKQEIHAAHLLVGKEDMNLDTFDAFYSQGLMNNTATFSHNEQWRPWQKAAQ